MRMRFVDPKVAQRPWLPGVYFLVQSPSLGPVLQNLAKEPGWGFRVEHSALGILVPRQPHCSLPVLALKESQPPWEPKW